MSVECPECGNLVDYSYDYCPEYNIVAYVYECEFCGCVFEEWLDERNEDISYGIVTSSFLFTSIQNVQQVNILLDILERSWMMKNSPEPEKHSQG